jgi:hypothetical protein
MPRDKPGWEKVAATLKEKRCQDQSTREQCQAERERCHRSGRVFWALIPVPARSVPAAGRLLEIIESCLTATPAQAFARMVFSAYSFPSQRLCDRLRQENCKVVKIECARPERNISLLSSGTAKRRAQPRHQHRRLLRGQRPRKARQSGASA